jgi:thiamine pyrophosphate-dependent acetolactate synthase large subunit-like protein
MTTGSTEKVNGAKALIKCLEKEGVDTLFGYPGGQIIPFYNELYDSDLRHILVRHEQELLMLRTGTPVLLERPGYVFLLQVPEQPTW